MNPVFSKSWRRTGFFNNLGATKQPNYILQMYLFSKDSLKTEKEIIFEHTELGHLYSTLPFAELSELLPKKTSKSGAPSWFSRQGLVALLFLQSYTKLSDRQFVDHFNGNWQMQMFCGVQLKINEAIKDKNLMSRVRRYVSEYMDLEKFQQVLIKYWRPYMSDVHVGMCDATVYESSLRYPTDVKLLWECCLYIQEQIEKLSKEVNRKVSNKRFEKKKQEYLSYAKRRKKTYRQTIGMRKSLLRLLEREVNSLQQLFNKYASESSPDRKKVFEKMRIIKVVIRQQRYLLTHKGSKISERILSLHKPYVRAIVRGKEIKAVEFGAKVHMMQVDGINYVEHLSYKAFNEATRLKLSIVKHKQLFGECTHWSADKIYATNKNRTYTTSNNITTNFIPKGPIKSDADEKTVRALLNKVRSTRLEGSFGTEKNYYGLSKVKARNEQNEKLCIYFSVMTANAVRISKRIRREDLREAA